MKQPFSGVSLQSPSPFLVMQEKVHKIDYVWPKSIQITNKSDPVGKACLCLVKFWQLAKSQPA